MPPTNVFADLRQDLHDELVTTLLVAANVRVERIISHGHASPEGFWYDHDQHELIVVLKGSTHRTRLLRPCHVPRLAYYGSTVLLFL